MFTNINFIDALILSIVGLALLALVVVIILHMRGDDSHVAHEKKLRKHGIMPSSDQKELIELLLSLQERGLLDAPEKTVWEGTPRALILMGKSVLEDSASRIQLNEDEIDDLSRLTALHA